MDSSYWNKLNPDIQFQDTVKLYFNRYLYRLVIHAAGGRLVNSSDSSLELALITRMSMEKMYNKSGWWGVRPNQLVKVDVKLLESVRLIKNKIPDIKIRVEEPSIQFYADSEDTLKKIAESLHNTGCITHINSPAANTEQLLLSNAILKKSATDYSCKVILKDGKYSNEIKQQILNYLDNLGAVVKISKSNRYMLGNTIHPHIWGVWFYTNDVDIVTFIRLIAPDSILNIHSLVAMPDK
jgi:hypothetical protein